MKTKHFIYKYVLKKIQLNLFLEKKESFENSSVLNSYSIFLAFITFCDPNSSVTI